MLNLSRGWFYALCALLAAGLLAQIGLLGYTAATVTALASAPTAEAEQRALDATATAEAEQRALDATATAEAEQLALDQTAAAEQRALDATATAEAEQLALDATATAEAEQLALDESVRLANTYLSIGTGPTFACGLTAGGVPRCWGELPLGWAPPPESSRYAALAVGPEFACGIREEDGGGECWGLKAPELPPFALRAIAISEGVRVCGISAETGNVLCEASGEWLPHELIGGPDYSGLKASAEGAILCAYDAIRVVCAEGASILVQEEIPTAQVSVSANGWCILATEGAVNCRGSFDPLNEPGLGLPALKDISLGLNFACWITAEAGEIGCGGEPLPPTPEGSFASLSTALTHICAIRDDGSATCWGLGASDPPVWQPDA